MLRSCVAVADTRGHAVNVVCAACAATAPDTVPTVSTLTNILTQERKFLGNFLC